MSELSENEPKPELEPITTTASVPIHGPEVYTHERLLALAEEIQLRNIRELVDVIKTDFLKEYSQSLWNKKSTMFCKTYNYEVKDVHLLNSALRKIFPDIYLHILSNYNGGISIRIDPSIKSAGDL
jgi:hypothetical protein